MDINYCETCLYVSAGTSAAVNSAVSADLSASLHKLFLIRKKLCKDRESILSSVSSFNHGSFREAAEENEKTYRKALSALETDGTGRAYTLFNVQCLRLSHISAKCEDDEDDIKIRHYKKRLAAIENDIEYIDAAAHRIQKQMTKG